MSIRETMWCCVAWVVSRPWVVKHLFEYAKRRPYTHLDGYMERYWLFNGYEPETYRKKFFDWLPSIRIHKILRADRDYFMHDHPWDARTIILRGWYCEEQLYVHTNGNESISTTKRLPGDTRLIKFGEYHSIYAVPPEGVLTLFISYRYRGKWGYWVNGRKIYHKTFRQSQEWSEAG
jgi:hypothetical protein